MQSVIGTNNIKDTNEAELPKWHICREEYHSDDINNTGTGTSISQISNYIILSEEEMTRIRDSDGTLD